MSAHAGRVRKSTLLLSGGQSLRDVDISSGRPNPILKAPVLFPFYHRQYRVLYLRLALYCRVIVNLPSLLSCYL